MLYYGISRTNLHTQEHPKMKIICKALVLLALSAPVLFAADAPATEHSDAVRQTAAANMVTVYRYFIEVPCLLPAPIVDADLEELRGGGCVDVD